MATVGERAFPNPAFQSRKTNSSIATNRERSDASARRDDAAVRADSVAATIGLAPHVESPATEESDSVNIRGLKLGDKTLSFNFSVQVSGHKAPMESKALGQLAVGCKRSLESVYRVKSAHLNKVNRKIAQLQATGTRIKKTLINLQKQLQDDLKVLDNIKSFDFKVREGDKDLFPKAILVVKGLDPVTRKEITTEIILDEEFTGEVVIAQRAINTLKAELQAKQAELLKLESIPARIEALQNQLTTARLADTTLDIEAKIEELQAEHTAAMAPEGRIAQFHAEMQRIQKQITALKDSKSHKVEIVQVRKPGTEDFVAAAKVTMTLKPENQEEGEEETSEKVSMNVFNISYLIHHSGTIKSAPAIVKDIQDAAEKALKSKTNDGKAFAKKVGESRKKAAGHSAVGAAGTSQAAREFQQAQARKRMADEMRMQQQFRQ